MSCLSVSDFEIDPKNGFRATKLARGLFLCKLKHFEELDQNLYKGPKGHFQIICAFFFCGEDRSKEKMVVPLSTHQFKHS